MRLSLSSAQKGKDGTCWGRAFTYCTCLTALFKLEGRSRLEGKTWCIYSSRAGDTQIQGKYYCQPEKEAMNRSVRETGQQRPEEDVWLEVREVNEAWVCVNSPFQLSDSSVLLCGS